MWHRVDLVWTDVSEERIASIFRVENLILCWNYPMTAKLCYYLKAVLHKLLQNFLLRKIHLSFILLLFKHP
jgi:hypothetical protein